MDSKEFKKMARKLEDERKELKVLAEEAYGDNNILISQVKTLTTKNEKLIIENKAIKKQNKKFTDQLNILRLNSTNEIREYKSNVIKLQDELESNEKIQNILIDGCNKKLEKKDKEIEDCIESKQGCPGVITWDFIFELIKERLTTKKKKQ